MILNIVDPINIPNALYPNNNIITIINGLKIVLINVIAFINTNFSCAIIIPLNTLKGKENTKLNNATANIFSVASK